MDIINLSVIDMCLKRLLRVFLSLRLTMPLSQLYLAYAISRRFLALYIKMALVIVSAFPFISCLLTFFCTYLVAFLDTKMW